MHQPLLLICGSISHICYCLQTLYFFKSGPVPRVLKIDGEAQDCDQYISKHAIELLENLVRSIIRVLLPNFVSFDNSQVEIFITAQENSCKSHDAEHLLHRFAQKEMVTSAHHCLLFFVCVH